jgi:ABC-type nickel/cobalt efflux system permease component RcnA
MLNGQELLLIAAVVGVGVLHTLVPDHWAPIALLARQRGWSRGETARAAFQAGFGHVATTLLFGLAVWLMGAAAAQRFGQVVDMAASAALVAFGAWIAFGAWREIQADAHGHGHGHGHSHGHPHDHAHDHGDAGGWEDDPLYAPSRGVAVAARHLHLHRHGGAPAHGHWHDHLGTTAHAVTADTAFSPPAHVHRHKTTGRMALLLVLGSSPMVEGIPAFFAASRYGVGLIALMSVAFAASTIATYVGLSVSSASGLQRVNLGPIGRYGEVISGAFIAAIGLAYGFWALI